MIIKTTQIESKWEVDHRQPMNKANPQWLVPTRAIPRATAIALVVVVVVVVVVESRKVVVPMPSKNIKVRRDREENEVKDAFYCLVLGGSSFRV